MFDANDDPTRNMWVQYWPKQQGHLMVLDTIACRAESFQDVHFDTDIQPEAKAGLSRAR